MKTCTSCGLAKPKADFSRDLRKAGATRSMCKKCHYTKYKPDKVKAAAYRAAWHQKNKRRRAQLKNRSLYGIEPVEYDAMLLTQGGRCASCGYDFEDNKKRTPHVDHCHVTELVRGLLCGECNTGLGKFRDNPVLLRAAAAYLERSR